jgi:alginate O-acetyltransferase complex protein AlgI
MAVPVLLLVTLFASSFFSLVLFPTGKLLPSVHEQPWKASSVADFWGKRWNTWFSDWFRSVLFRRTAGHAWRSTITVFAVSGLMHELVLNLPLYIVTGSNQFGSMMLYFLIQPAMMRIERRFRSRLIRRLLAWGSVVIPAPLILNEALLRVLHLWR